MEKKSNFQLLLKLTGSVYVLRTGERAPMNNHELKITTGPFIISAFNHSSLMFLLSFHIWGRGGGAERNRLDIKKELNTAVSRH